MVKPQTFTDLACTCNWYNKDKTKISRSLSLFCSVFLACIVFTHTLLPVRRGREGERENKTNRASEITRILHDPRSSSPKSQPAAKPRLTCYKITQRSGPVVLTSNSSLHLDTSRKSFKYTKQIFGRKSTSCCGQRSSAV